MSRLRIPLLAITALVLLAGCALPFGASDESEPGSTATSTPLDSSEPPELISLSEARSQFVASVCPTDTALHILNNVALVAEGWDKVTPDQAAPYAQGAVTAASSTISNLENVVWPSEIASDIPTVIEEHREIQFLLGRIESSVTGSDMKAVWQELRTLPRLGEQRIRLQLGLGDVWSQNDGCPPPPPVANSDASSERPTTSSAGWTTLWESPSGNLRCGFAPRGSRGVPVAACLDSDTNTLARLPRGYAPVFSEATASQRAQLPGGFVLEFYQSVAEYGLSCSLEDSGMTCIDGSTGAGFIIRRGVAFPI